MFRCENSLKGILIDVDSFNDFSVADWLPFMDRFSCLFFTCDPKKYSLISNSNDNSASILFDAFSRPLFPNMKMLSQCLSRFHLQTTEIAFISCDYEFVKNSLSFACVNIWIATTPCSYEQASLCPDLIINNISDLWKVLNCDCFGYFGELFSIPLRSNMSKHMTIIETSLTSLKNHNFTVISSGRYFGSHHFMYNLHPLSTRIFLNKSNSSAARKTQDTLFTIIYSQIVRVLMESLTDRSQQINAICSVPVRPGHDNRFNEIVSATAVENKLSDVSESFFCVKDYQTQKGLGYYERLENVRGVFKFKGDLTEKNIVLFDDVITTGATICTCVDALFEANANSVYVISLAINQTGCSYWSSEIPIVACPICKEGMSLRINSMDSNLFFSCYNCYCSTPSIKSSQNFSNGIASLLKKVDCEIPSVTSLGTDEEI